MSNKIRIQKKVLRKRCRWSDKMKYINEKSFEYSTATTNSCNICHILT